MMHFFIVVTQMIRVRRKGGIKRTRSRRMRSRIRSIRRRKSRRGGTNHIITMEIRDRRRGKQEE